MDLFIETLTGTAFELRVSPFETIMSVKAKIQRQEGVPIAQQHLIWQQNELEDDYCLHDYAISEGATLKLVLAMRGGPINTRRVPMDDPALREMAEYMEANREELLDKLPGNHQVTLLLYRDGDQLKFCRFLDMGDGTLTPLSESLSAGSVCQQYEDEDDEEGGGNKEKVEENDKTKEKMAHIRAKLENLTLGKKPKKKHHVVSNVVCRTPSSSRPGSRGRLRHLISSPGGKAISPPGALSAHRPLPPVGQTIASPTVAVASPTVDYYHEGSSPSDDGVVSSSLRPLESAKFRRLPAVAEDGCLTAENETATAHAALDLGLNNLETIVQRSQLTSSSRRRNKPSPDHMLPGKSELLPLDSSTNKDNQSRPHSTKPEFSLDALKDLSHVAPATSRALERLLSLDSPHPPSTKKDKDHVHSRPRSKISNIEPMSQSEARGLLRQASLEHVASSKLGSLVASGAGKLNRNSLTSTALKEVGRICTPEGRMVSARHHKMSATRDGRISPSSRLPPVKQKRKYKRCSFCNKKTGIASSYQCRCGSNFCATHRYAEVHGCTFDYKLEGRKLLEQTNPVVSAPKLPKI